MYTLSFSYTFFFLPFNETKAKKKQPPNLVFLGTREGFQALEKSVFYLYSRHILCCEEPEVSQQTTVVRKLLMLWHEQELFVN